MIHSTRSVEAWTVSTTMIVTRMNSSYLSLALCSCQATSSARDYGLAIVSQPQGRFRGDCNDIPYDD